MTPFDAVDLTLLKLFQESPIAAYVSAAIFGFFFSGHDRLGNKSSLF